MSKEPELNLDEVIGGSANEEFIDFHQKNRTSKTQPEPQPTEIPIFPPADPSPVRWRHCAGNKKRRRENTMNNKEDAKPKLLKEDELDSFFL